jgi:hypothetical protein
LGVLQARGEPFDFGAGEAGGDGVIGVAANVYASGVIPPHQKGAGVGAIHGAGGNYFHGIFSTKIILQCFKA